MNSGPRRALAAFFCASLLLPSPALAAAVAELSLRPAVAGLALPPATLVPPAFLAAPAGLLTAAPAPLALNPATFVAAAAAPEAEPELAVAAAAAPAQIAPEQVRPGRLRSATLAARALAFLTVSALIPKAAPLPAASYLRENQDYTTADKRGALGDGSVVENETGRSPYRVTMSHPGLKEILARADAIKNGGQDEDGKLKALRSAIAGVLPRGRDIQVRALEVRAERSRKAVELGAFSGRGHGGEREAALLANIALGRAGFKPKLIRVNAWHLEDGRVIEEPRTLNLVHTARGQILFDTVSPALDGKKVQDATAPAGTPGVVAGITAELDGPRVFTPAGKAKTSGMTARTIDNELSFAVVGRSAADRIFKDDEKNYQSAAADAPVTVEWLYFPFYVDGHTALRIGDKLYEFTRKGWRTNSARAFLFNNPYFDTQMARHPTLGIPPFSLGVPLSVKKADAERFAARAAAGKGWFSFWFNNCNQVPYRFLRRLGITFGDGAFASFSSIRAFRLLLLHPPEQAGAPRLYPLPNQASAVEPLGPAVPRNLTTERSVLVDFALFVWNWPKFIFEKLPLTRRSSATPPAPKG